MDLADNLALGPVTVVLPTYNEEAGIGPQIEAIRQALEQHGIEHEILVIDDGSEDKTALAATAAGARLMCNLENRGYGASLKTGIQAATYPTIVITDADGTYPSDQIPALLARLQTADMAVGSRTGKHVKIPLIRRPAKWMLGWLANRIAGRRIPDLNSGLRAFRRNVVEQYFGILSDRFSFTTTVTLALLADGYRVVYHPIDYYARVGKSKIKPVDFMEFLILVLRLAILFQPLRIFVPLSAAVGGLGVLKVVLDVIAFFPRQSGADWSLWYNAVLSTSALLLLLVAFQLLLIGMVADAVIRKIGQHVPRVPSHAPVSSEQAPGHLSSKEGHVAP
jgi:glycosyltransferase involved in cell wall biosynthesis